jgi:hypothetical protein
MLASFSARSFITRTLRGVWDKLVTVVYGASREVPSYAVTEVDTDIYVQAEHKVEP